MQPVVHATTRTPGPSTADPVVNECRNPMSPEARALRTVDSGTFRPRSTRSSKGSFAVSGVSVIVSWSDTCDIPVERAGDDVHLLLAREPHEVHGVARHANREIRVFLRMVHRVEQRVAIEHIDVDVKAGRAEERVEHPGEVGDTVLGNAAEAFGDESGGEGKNIPRVTGGGVCGRPRGGGGGLGGACWHR